MLFLLYSIYFKQRFFQQNQFPLRIYISFKVNQPHGIPRNRSQHNVE